MGRLHKEMSASKKVAVVGMCMFGVLCLVGIASNESFIELFILFFLLVDNRMYIHMTLLCQPFVGAVGGRRKFLG